MRIYKKKSWKLKLFLTTYLPLCIILYISVPVAVDNTINSINNGINLEPVALIVMLFSTLLLIAIIILPLLFHNYLIIGDHSLIIKNVFFSFIKQEYRYADIESCEIGDFSGGYPDYFYVKLHDKWTWKLKWRIALVDNKSYPELFADLGSKKVIVMKKIIR